MIALPRLHGPHLPGLPDEPDGFAVVDTYGRVRGLDRVWAVGDMTTRPLKQGGLAAQQADVAAADLAAEVAAAPVRVAPYKPKLQGRAPHRRGTAVSRAPAARSLRQSRGVLAVPRVARTQGRRTPPRSLPGITRRDARELAATVRRHGTGWGDAPPGSLAGQGDTPLGVSKRLGGDRPRAISTTSSTARSTVR